MQQPTTTPTPSTTTSLTCQLHSAATSLLRHISDAPCAASQAALRIVAHQLEASGNTAALLRLTLAIGQCCSLNNDASTRTTLSALCAGDDGLIHTLLTALDSAHLADDPHTAAAAVRAVQQLVVLDHSSNPSPSALVSTLSAAWSDPQQRARLLLTACSSADAADAVAALAATAARLGLPAAALLDGLPLAGRRGGSNNSGVTNNSWLACGLQPLVLRILLELQQWWPHSTTRSSSNTASTTAKSAQLPRQASTTTPQGFQQLWLLLCAAVRTTDGQLLDGAVLDTLGQLLKSPAVTETIHAVLLAPTGPAAADASTDTEAGSTTASSSGSCHHYSALRGPTLQLLSCAAGHSVGLARQCFHILVPVVVDALVACGMRSGGPAVADAAAVLQLWQLLLLKGRSLTSALQPLLQQWLPDAASALSEAAAAATAMPACADALSRAHAVAAVFVPLAEELQSSGQLALKPAVVLSVLIPTHVLALGQLVKTAAADVPPSSDTAASASAVAVVTNSGAASGCTLLLAVWLLRAWLSALQEQQKQQQQQQERWAASILSTLQPQLLSAAAAALLRADSSDAQLQLRCQTALLELVRALLACQAAVPPETALAVSPQPQALAHGTPCQMHQLLVALGSLFARHPRDPMILAARQLLLTGCKLLADLLTPGGQLEGQLWSTQIASTTCGDAATQGTVVRLSVTLAACKAAVVVRVVVVCENVGPGVGEVPPEQHQQLQQHQQQDQDWVLRRLCVDLQALHDDVASRKLARSGSREELLQAAGDVLQALAARGFAA